MSPSPYSLLIVDDMEVNRTLLDRLLKKDNFHLSFAEDGHEALEKIRVGNFDLVLLDIMMPNLDGIQVLSSLKTDEKLRHIPVIMISALNEMDNVVRCIEMGAEDYLPKPFNRILLRARVNASLEKKRVHDLTEDYRRRIEGHNSELKTRVREQVREIASTQLATIFAMSKLAESRDPETGQHLERVREYCVILAIKLNQGKYFNIDADFIENIYAASPLHDIGKVGVPDHVLLKPGKLTDEERTLMETHSTVGAETLRAVNDQHPGNAFVSMGIDIAESHHEKWDGSGYPQKLSGDAIPLSARIVALADVYDALTSKRCYKDAFSHEKAVGIIQSENGRHFDPRLVEAFCLIEQEFKAIQTFHYEEGEE
ncbi:MAG: response regulator [Betaproteobacteria bacterium]|nr:response regulator [Betaproteobacteria bacterium]